MPQPLFNGNKISHHPRLSLLDALSVFLLLLLTGSTTFAQAVKLVPPAPSPTDSVTLIFDASKGNKALENYTGDVYLHTRYHQ